MHAIRAMRTEHDGLFDVASARWPGDEIDGARQLAQLGSGQGECILHVRDDAMRRNDGDVGLGQQAGRCW